ncbi:hypothetical protein EC988_002890 [Linderina pennispora]|nr:hypothetical protein EC988_002890 [Linderina pennispora]
MDRLPPHIIEYIIAHTTGRGRLVPGLLTNTYTPAVPHALFPLMGVCQKWRDIAKRFIGEPAIVFVNSRKPTPQGKSEHVYHLRDVIAARLEQRVRHLLLDFTVEEIRDGVAYSMFDSLVSQCKGKFRNVHTITLHTSLRDSYYWVYNRQTGVPVINLQDLANMEKEVSQNARRIGDLVREAMPNVVSVAYLGPYNHTLDSTCLNCAILSALLAAAPSIQYLSIPVGELSRTILDNVLVPNITQMHVFLPVGKSDGITELAIRYADRLETLSVDAIDDESFIMLFKSPADESPVVYSKLHTFKLTRSNFWTRGEDSYTLKINPFPKLRQFICKVTDMSTHGFVKELNLAGIQYTIVETVHLIKRLPALQLLVLMLKSSNDVNERGDITDADIERFQQRYIQKAVRPL